MSRDEDEQRFDAEAALASARDLLERLKAEPPAPKLNLAIVLLEETCWRIENERSRHRSS